MNVPVELEGRSTTNVATAAKVLGIGINQAYAAVRAGEIKSVRLGGRYVIPVAPLLRMLDLDDSTTAA